MEIPIVVTDSSGKPISGLKAEDSAIMKLRPNSVSRHSVLSYNLAAEEISGMLSRKFT
jgi:hypothetical protein